MVFRLFEYTVFQPEMEDFVSKDKKVVKSLYL